MKGRAKRARRAVRPPPDAPLAAAAASGSEHAPAQPDVARRAPSADDTCPICMEGLDSGGSLVWCREGCGNNVHRHCMLVWARHRGGGGGGSAQRGGGGGGEKEGATTCPMCRAPWGEIGLPEREERPRQTAAQRREQRLRALAEADAATHFGVQCAGCKASALVGVRFRCIICEEYNLCTLCFANEGTHAQHTFECVRRPGQPWEAADRGALARAVRERLAAGAAAGAAADGGGEGDALRLLGDPSEGSAEAQLARLARVQMPLERLVGSGGHCAGGADEEARGETAGAGSVGRRADGPVPPSADTQPARSRPASAAPAQPAPNLARCAHCRRVARKHQWFKALRCGHHLHESCLPDWLREHHGRCPTCREGALTPAAIAAAAAAHARDPPASCGARAAPGRAGSAAADGGRHGGAPQPAGRPRGHAHAAGKRHSLGGVGSAAPPLGLGLGVTGCALGACGQSQRAGGAQPGSGLATMGLAGRGIGACAAPLVLSVGGAPRQKAPVPGRLARGTSTAPATWSASSAASRFSAR